MTKKSIEFARVFDHIPEEQLIKILEKSQMKYAYNKDTKIYSIRYNLKGAKGVFKERVLTMRVSPKFLEYSIADANGNILEIMKQEGAKLSFQNFAK
ncbi:MAG: hypothetical protein WC501_01360 [Candidatus Micrarchaeia archaeon]